MIVWGLFDSESCSLGNTCDLMGITCYSIGIGKFEREREREINVFHLTYQI